MKRTTSFLAAVLLPLSLFGQSYPIVPGGGGGGGSGTVTSVGASSSSAALGITGSPISTSGTFAFTMDADLTQFAALADPAAHRFVVWNDTTNQYAFAVIGSGLSFDGTTMTATGSGGGAPTDATYITQIANGTLTNEQVLGALATGLVKNTTTTGVLSIATAGTDYATAFSHLSGSATDAQIPNTITIDLATLATTANAGDSASSFFTSGQIERARGGTGADTSAYADGLIGSDASNATVDVDNLTKLSTALGIGGTPSATTFIRGDSQWATPAGGGGGGGDMLAANNLSDLTNLPTARTNLGVAIVASGFDGNLATSDDTIQEVAQKVDDLLPGGAAPTNASYITQTSNATLTGEQALGALATGILKSTTTTGVISIASAGTDYLAPTGNGSALTGIDFSQLTGSIADGQIPSAIARDSEVAATYALQATTMTMSGTANEINLDVGAQNLSANRAWTFSLSNTVDLGGKASFEVPNSASPTPAVFGQIAGDNDAFAAGRGTLVTYDGTAITRLVGVLASDTPVDGHVPTYTSGGTVLWQPVTATAPGSTNQIPYNVAGSFSSEAGFEYDPSTNIFLAPSITTANLNAATFKTLDSVNQSHGLLLSVASDLTADKSFIYTGAFNFNMTLTADSSPTFPAGTTTLAHTTGPAGSMTVVASGFNGNLATTDDTLQEVSQKLDDLSVGAASGDPILIGGTAVTDAAGVNLVVGAGLDLTLTGSAPQVATFDVDTTEFVGARSWGSGADASQVWTWDLTAGDPAITFSNAVVNVSSGALQVGGVVVPTISSTSTLTNKDLTNANNTLPAIQAIACSDMTTAITAAGDKAYWRPPFAITVTGVFMSAFTAPTGAALIVDIEEGGTSILGANRLQIDATENRSEDAVNQPTISDSAIAAGALVTIDFDQIGSTVAGAGIIVTLVYTY